MRGFSKKTAFFEFFKPNLECTNALFAKPTFVSSTLNNELI